MPRLASDDWKGEDSSSRLVEDLEDTCTDEKVRVCCCVQLYYTAVQPRLARFRLRVTGTERCTLSVQKITARSCLDNPGVRGLGVILGTCQLELGDRSHRKWISIRSLTRGPGVGCHLLSFKAAYFVVDSIMTGI